MKNLKNNLEITKKEISKKAETKKVNTEDLQSLLLLQKSKINVAEKEKAATKTKDKNFIYKFQLDADKLTAKEEKKKRSKLRRELTNIVNKIIIENLKETNLKSVPDFISFYKKEYINNDFTLSSLTNSSEESKINDLNIVLTLCKIFLSTGDKKEVNKKEKVSASKK